MAIGGSDLSRRALIEAIVRSEEEWQAVASFCEAVMLVKEEADPDFLSPLARSFGRRLMGSSISTHPVTVRTEPKSSTTCTIQQGRSLLGPRGDAKAAHRGPGTKAGRNGGSFSQ
ncbi:hypothetical protein PYW08_006526 [Mythimna loreyi]|uniref:Uncharacterized protein n=1 Tax=Mythimna loreyi TaxID=667449 RepID=A0ACC2QN79_9NEOP|nr:hypothetical protein PYW08_006526 [Mythimna loreyi]